MAADTLVNIGADLSEMRRELAKMPNMAGDAAQEMLIRLERTVASAESAAKSAAKNSAKAVKEANEATKKGLKGLIELGGVSGEVFEKLGNVGGALANPIVMAGVAALAASVSVAALTGAVIALVTKASDLDDALDPFNKIAGFEGLSREAEASFARVDGALAGIGTVAQAAAVTMAEELAPAAERVTRLMLTVGVAALDTFQTFSDGQGVIRSLAEWFVTGLAEAITVPMDRLAGMAGLLKHFAKAAGMDEMASAFYKVQKSWDDFKETTIDGVVDGAFDELGHHTTWLTDRFAGYADQVDGLINKHIQLANSTKGTSKAEKELADALKTIAEINESATVDQLDEIGKINFERAKTLKLLWDLGEAEGAMGASIEASVAVNAAADAKIDGIKEEAAKKESERIKKLSDERAKAEERAREDAKKTAEAAKAAQLSSASAILGGFADLSSAMGTLAQQRAEKLGKIDEEAALRAHRVSQAGAIGQIGMATAVAVMQALAQLGPVAGAIASAGIVATGAAQAAVVATQEPPAFDVGGLVGHGGLVGSRTPDQVQIRALPGERVQSREEVAAMRRPQSIVVEQRYGHRVFDAFIADNIRRPSSPLRKFLTEGR